MDPIADFMRGAGALLMLSGPFACRNDVPRTSIPGSVEQLVADHWDTLGEPFHAALAEEVARLTPEQRVEYDKEIAVGRELALSREVYEDQAPGLLEEHEDEYVLIKSGQVCGFFDSEWEAFCASSQFPTILDVVFVGRIKKAESDPARIELRTGVA